MLQHLANNVYHFSVAKNYTHLQQLTSLINDNGRIREWKSYKEEAEKLNFKFNKTWLKTEYDFANAGATMASKWTEWDSRGEDVLLRYSTVGDSRVRDEHRILNGITLPKKHPFWNTHYPPNGFKCRCDVEVVPNGYAHTKEDAIPNEIDSIPPMMRVNLAKEKLAFPPKHPYYKGKALDSRLFNTSPMPIAQVGSKAVYTTEASRPFTTSATELVRQNIEYKQRIRAAKAMSKQYNDNVMLLPKVDYEDEFRYNIFFNPKHYLFAPHSADCILMKNKIYFDVKSYENKFDNTTVKNMLKKANLQADTCVIVMNHNKPIDVIKTKITDRITRGNYKNLKNIYVLLKNDVLIKIL